MKHTVWPPKKKKKTKVQNASFRQKPYIYLYLSSHVQLSLTLWPLCSTPRLSGLCSPSPLSHTISLSTHSHTHTISLSRVSTPNSLTLCSLSPLRYQSQAFNLSFSWLSHALIITQCFGDLIFYFILYKL